MLQPPLPDLNTSAWAQQQLCVTGITCVNMLQPGATCSSTAAHCGGTWSEQEYTNRNMCPSKLVLSRKGVTV